MATTHSPVAPFGAITVHRITSSLTGIVDRVRAWNDTRRTVKALRGLNARQLDDIGLTPADVEHFADRGF
jgi:uncharacterized protein YjiS (DUF1127 family)